MNNLITFSFGYFQISTLIEFFQASVDFFDPLYHNISLLGSHVLELGFHESTLELGQLLISDTNFIKCDPLCIKYNPWIKIVPHFIKFCPSMILFSLVYLKKSIKTCKKWYLMVINGEMR